MREKSMGHCTCVDIGQLGRRCYANDLDHHIENFHKRSRDTHRDDHHESYHAEKKGLAESWCGLAGEMSGCVVSGDEGDGVACRGPG
ncbi:unnamed protein product [Prunus armeniaca]|uniref:Uncharacterized protein n=1 Tax=Prunus armeniaca TaxID=36596 RepID=A0A6J5VL96_PRUAR|nr:unnamed protein product [Prunus armeniaca]